MEAICEFFDAFNLNSHPQTARLLYAPKRDGGQGLHPWKLTAGALKAVRAKPSLASQYWSYGMTLDEVMEVLRADGCIVSPGAVSRNMPWLIPTGEHNA